MADEERIDTCVHSADGRFSDAEMVGDRLHFEIVRDQNAIEIELAAEESLDGLRAHGGGNSGVDRFENDMRGHDAFDTRGDCRAEGEEFHRIESRAVVRESRKIEV